MHPLDRLLLDAYDHATRHGELHTPSLGEYLRRPLRSLAVVIRAGDTRWPDDAYSPRRPGVAGGNADRSFGDRRPHDATPRSTITPGKPGAKCDGLPHDTIHLTASLARRICEPVRIDPPGIPIAHAAARFGVGVNSIRRWHRAGVLRIDRFHGIDSDPAMQRSVFDTPRTEPPSLREGPREGTRGLRIDRDDSTHAARHANHTTRADTPRSPSQPPPEGEGSEPFTSRFPASLAARRTFTPPPKRSARYFPLSKRRHTAASGRSVPATNIAFVTTPIPILPGGEVLAGRWGSVTRSIHERIDDAFEQTLTRIRRPIGGPRQGGQWQWLCPTPGCGAMTFKLYLPGRPFTVGEFLGREAPEASARPLIASRFVCRTCAGLVYESTERTSRDSAGRRVDPFDRFVQRITAGLVRAADLR